MRIAVAACILCLLSGCGGTQPLAKRTPQEAAMFGAATMRIHPIFSEVKDWTGDGSPDGVEALVEFQDGFGDPTKAAGTAVFELFDFRPHNPDPRGRRVVEPWVTTVITPQEQRARWNRTSRTYAFQLALDGVAADRDYVLTVSFDRAATPASVAAEARALADEPAADAAATRPGAQVSNPGGANRLFDRIVLEAQRKEGSGAEPAAAAAASTTRPARP